MKPMPASVLRARIAVIERAMRDPFGDDFDPNRPDVATLERWARDLAAYALALQEAVRAELADLESRFGFAPGQVAFIEKALAVEKLALRPAGRRSGKSTYQRIQRLRALLPADESASHPGGC